MFTSLAQRQGTLDSCRIAATRGKSATAAQRKSQNEN